MTSALIAGSPRRRVKEAAFAQKATSVFSEWVDAAPCDGVARNNWLAAVIELLGLFPVQSWTAIVSALIQPRISKTIPLGAASVNSGVVKQVACVCHSCPMRRLVGSKMLGRSGRGANGDKVCRRFLMVGDHRQV